MDCISHLVLGLLMALPVTATLETRDLATIPQYVIDYGEYRADWELA